MNENLYELLIHWFYITKQKDKKNDIVLLLFDIGDIYFSLKDDTENYNIVKYNGRDMNFQENTILIVDKKDSLINLNFFKNIFLLIPSTDISTYNMKYFRSKKWVPYIEDYEESLSLSLSLLKSIEPIDIIRKYNYNDMKLIIEFRINNIFKNNSDIALLIGDTTFKKNIFLKEILSDIEILYKASLLTSRLALVIYRLAYLNTNANKLKIGKYFHEKLGVKSKTFSKTNPRLDYIDSIKIVNIFKAYDLSFVSEKEKEIRKEIAFKLGSMTNISKEMILKITNYNIDTGMIIVH